MSKQPSKSDTVLAFVTDEASEEAIKNLPLKEAGLTLTVIKGTVKTAYEYLKDNHSPRILLVDISESKLPISDVAALAEVCEPGVEVIAVGKSNDIAIFRGLLNLGVKDYIVKPLNANLLGRSFAGVLSGENKTEKVQGFSRLGGIISFIGAHGGVGTSTLAANCSWVLAEKHFKHVYLLDLHLKMGMLCHFFNLSPTPGLLDILSQPERIDQNLIEKSFEKFNERLIIASTQENLSDKTKIVPESIHKLFSLISNQSHFSIVDVPRDFNNPLTSLVLSESNMVVIVVDFTLLSIRDTTRIIELVKEGDRKDQKIIIVANRIGEYKQGELERSVFEKAIQRQVDCTIRFDPLNVLEAMNAGVPAVMGNHMLAHDIQMFANIFVGKEISTESGFFTKLMSSLSSRK